MVKSEDEMQQNDAGETLAKIEKASRSMWAGASKMIQAQARDPRKNPKRGDQFAVSATTKYIVSGRGATWVDFKIRSESVTHRVGWMSLTDWGNRSHSWGLIHAAE